MKSCLPGVARSPFLNHFASAALLSLIIAAGAGPGHGAEPAPGASLTLVGNLGRKEALVFEGNQAFSSAEITKGLRQSMEYFAVAHPSAPLGQYVASLERLVATGYKHGGFPDPQVTASADVPGGRIRVKITEGIRYKTGQVRFSGVKAIQDAAVQQQLRDALAGLPAAGSGTTDTNALIVLWPDDGYVPFQENSTMFIADRLTTELAALQFYNPKLHVTIEPNPATRTADLVVEMLDEGLRGTLAQISVLHGMEEHKNSSEDVIAYLGLKEGMTISPTLLGEVTNRLYQSGRFLVHEAALVPQTEVGHFKLELHLLELDEAPPLAQALSTNQVIFIKLANWLSNIQTQREDLTFNMAAEVPGAGRLGLEVVLARAGVGLVVRSLPSNSPPRLEYATVLAPEGLGYYSGWRHEKLLVPGGKNVKASVELTPNGRVHGNRFNLQMAGGVTSKEGEPPLDLKIRVAPVKCIHSLDGLKGPAAVKDGVLEAAIAEPGLSEAAELIRIDAATGRLLDLHFQRGTNASPVHSLRVSTEAGAYQRLTAQLAAETASWKDAYVKDYGYSSWFGFVFSDLFESGVLETGMVSNLVVQGWSGSPANAAAFRAAAAQIRSGLAELKRVSGKPDLIHCLMPLEDQLASLKPSASDTNRGFTLPLTQMPQSSMQAFMELLGGWIIDKADDIWQPGSWPWTLTRETAFTLAHQPKYTDVELEKLLAGNAAGPLGSAAAAALLAKFNAPVSEKFVRRGLDQLTVPDLRKDLDVLLAPETLAGKLFGTLLAGFSRLKDPELDALATVVGGGSTNFLRETAQVLRAGTNVAPAEALLPTLQRYWDPLLRPRLEGQLKELLAKVGPPTTPVAAFKRAGFIFSNASKDEDVQAALQLLQQSAEQGYGRAQFQLAGFYRTGKPVARDYAVAQQWYLRALTNKVPHAACCLGDLYFNGEGVERNVETALGFFLLEATNGCAGAQARVAQCLEQQSKVTEALAFYRLAGTNGSPVAQVALGDRLTDALSCPVDNAEAYFWYSVAAERGNRVAVVSARRLKTNKLKPEQVKAIDKEVYRLVDKIEEQEQDAAKREAAL